MRFFLILLGFLITLLNFSHGQILSSVVEGGNLEDRGLAVVRINGNVFVGGFTLSNDFTYLSGSHGGGKDIFIIKYNEDLSQILKGIYYGGSGDEEIFDIKTDPSGYIYVAGYTTSPAVCAGASVRKALILKLNQNLGIVSKLCMGGSQDAEIRKIWIDGSNIYAVGTTKDSIGSFPGFSGSSDAFLAKLDTDLNLIDLLYIGGSGADKGYDITVTDTDIFIGGITRSTDLIGSSTGFQNSPGGGGDAFISKINKLSFSLVGSTYLGGAGEEKSISLVYRSSDSKVIATVETASPDLPVSGGDNSKGTVDIYIALIDENLQSLLRSTYIGGSNEEVLQVSLLDTSDNLYIVGKTLSPDFPVLNTSIQTNYLRNGDAFIIVLDTNLSVIASTYLGGNGEDIIHNIYA